MKEKLFAVLKQYAAEKKVDWLASVLPDILTTDEQQTLIGNIRYRSLCSLGIIQTVFSICSTTCTPF